MFRKKGISLLVPTQNSEQTVELCLRSFAEFPDEMIVVDNGSTDRTIEIVRDLEGSIPNMRFYDAPHLKDLYANRQYALERSRYNWIVRIDSDYVAYTDGLRDIRHLRERVLQTSRTLRPTVLGIKQVNVFHDIYHTGKELQPRESSVGRWVSPPVSTLPARIIQHYPGLRFKRLGRWEGIRFQRYLNHVKLEEPYWFHCTFKDPVVLLYRSERTNWRERGDFKRFPTLDTHVRTVIQEKYGTNDLKTAAEAFFAEHVAPLITRYDPEKYYPFPTLLLEAQEQQQSSLYRAVGGG